VSLKDIEKVIFYMYINKFHYKVSDYSLKKLSVCAKMFMYVLEERR